MKRGIDQHTWRGMLGSETGARAKDGLQAQQLYELGLQSVAINVIVLLARQPCIITNLRGSGHIVSVG